MILTCHDCPRQIAFPGKSIIVRFEVARLFGWRPRAGEGFLCVPCQAEAQGGET